MLDVCMHVNAVYKREFCGAGVMLYLKETKEHIFVLTYKGQLNYYWDYQ